MFTTARHWSLSWGSWIQFTPSLSITLRYILILSYHLRLYPPSDLFLQVFRWKFRIAFWSVMHATCPACLLTLIISGEAYKLWSCSLCSLLQPPATSNKHSPQTPSVVETELCFGSCRVCDHSMLRVLTSRIHLIKLLERQLGVWC
jgi:hypothetical protein